MKLPTPRNIKSAEKIVEKQAPAIPQHANPGKEWALSPFDRYGEWVAWGLIAVAILVGFLYVNAYGVNIGWEDQLNNMPPVFEKWDAGTLRLGDFWGQINEHRHFFPFIAMFLLALATAWSTLAEMYFIQTMFLVMLVLAILALRRSSGGKDYAWYCVPIALMAFSLRQNQNMLTGFQIAFVMTAALSLATFFCLHLMTDPRRLKLKFAFALALATLAGLSAAQGLLVWWVGLAQLLVLAQPWRRKATLSAIWSLVGIVEWVVYFWGYTKPAWHPPLSFSWEYFMAIIGGALFPIVLVAQAAGAIILLTAIAAVVLARLDWKGGRHTFWLALILFGLMTEAQTTVGRTGFGPQQALSSRYATFSLFVVIALTASSPLSRRRNLSGMPPHCGACLSE